MKNINRIMNFARLSASRNNLEDLLRNVKCDKLTHSWPTVADDDEETAILRRISCENHELLVQLDAAREALFTHQSKTQDNMEKMEEEMEHLREKLSEVINGEQEALHRVKSLEMALQDMQSEKQLIQKTTSQSFEDLLKAEAQKQNDLQEQISRLNRELENKEEENIGLRMTILKVQEDLTKENHLKDAAIEQREIFIDELKSELAEMRMKGEVKSHLEAKECQSSSQETGSTPNSVKEQNTSEIISLLKEKVDEQEGELIRLREENQSLRDKVFRDSDRQLAKINGDHDVHLDTNGESSLSVQEGDGEDDVREPEELRLVNGETEEDDAQDKGEPVVAPRAPEDAEKEEAIYRLQLRLHETEESYRKAQDRADHMTYLLNQKLIELNKLQLTLSGQTKEMINLEKAYFQLKCHLNKGFRSSTPSSRHSSRFDLSTT